MGVSDCLELESAFNQMLFYCEPLSSFLLPSSSVEHLPWKGQIIVFLCDPVKILVSKQNTRGEQQFNLLSLDIAKRASEVSSKTYCTLERLFFCSQSAAGSKMFPTLKIHQDKNAMNWAPAQEPPLFDSGDIRKPENKNSGNMGMPQNAILTMGFKKCLFYTSRKYMINSTSVQNNPKNTAEKKI